MKYEHITEGRFIDRPNRFIAHVEINGQVETVHVKNTGRSRELLIPGTQVFLERSSNPARKTDIGEGRWGMAATEILLCLLFLYPTFREVQKALRKKKAREIACWFESYAQNTVSFEKLEQELGKGAVKKLEKFIARGYIRNIQIDREGNYIMITAPNRRVNEKIYITVTCTSCGAKNQVIKGRLSNCEYCGQRLNS